MPMKLDEAYAILKVSSSASEIEIKQAYKKLALKTHPDKNPNDPEAHKTFLQVSEAYKRITDPDSFRNEDDGDGGMDEDEVNMMFAHMFGGMDRGGGHFHGPPPEMFMFMHMMDMFVDEFDDMDGDAYADEDVYYYDEEEDDEEDDEDDEGGMDYFDDDMMRNMIFGGQSMDGHHRGYASHVKIPKSMKKTEKDAKLTPQERKAMEDELNDLAAYIEGTPKKGKRSPLRQTNPAKMNATESVDDPESSSKKKNKKKMNKKKPLRSSDPSSQSVPEDTNPIDLNPTSTAKPSSTSLPTPKPQASQSSKLSSSNAKPTAKSAHAKHMNMVSSENDELDDDNDAGWETDSSDDMKRNRTNYSSAKLIEEIFLSQLASSKGFGASVKSKQSTSTDSKQKQQATPTSTSSSSSKAPAKASAPQQAPSSSSVRRGVSLGDRVIVQNKYTGTAAYVGEVHYTKGNFVGIITDDEDVGKNNGTIKGVKYFVCAERRGLVVHESDVKLL